MCSKCYKEFGPKTPAPAKNDEKSAEPTVAAVVTVGEPSVAVAAIDAPAEVPQKKVQTKKDRCFTCNKKLRLAQQFNCKCEYVFCSEHRYADKHECEFDWSGKNKELLAKNNPAVISDRLNRI
jgi:hypothetical protein